MKRLILVGGGHAHLSVLELLAREKPSDLDIILVTPSHFQNYSGMLPGWMAGHYQQAQSQIDLQALAQKANVQMIIDHIIGIDPEQQFVTLKDGQHIHYDLLSLDVGSEINVSGLEMAGEKLLPVKPLDTFFEAWPHILASAKQKTDYRLVIVGGGAAGVELTLAAKYAFTQHNINGRVDIVVSESGFLAGHAANVQHRISNAMNKAKVTIHRQRGVGVEEGLLLSDGSLLIADCVIAATGARALSWLKHSQLNLDENNYIIVDENHRSISHSNVFAAGDVCARQDVAMARSGVHAVHAGPILANNLLATLKEMPLQAYRPRSRSLYLLACGSQYAVASWGQWSVEGKWVWHWKDWIDRGFIKRFSN